MKSFKVLAALGAAFLLVPALASAAPVVPPTTTVTVSFVDSTDAPIVGAPVESWNGTAWVPFGSGTTDASGTVVVAGYPTTPSGLKVRVTYAGRTATRGQNIRTNPNFDFQTTRAEVRLEKQDTTGIAGGVVEVAQGGTWVSFGTTDGSGIVAKELLPGSYAIRTTYNGRTVQKSANISSPIVFTTVEVTLHSSAAITYNSKSPNTWSTFTGPTMELLPGSYILRADDVQLNQRLMVAGDSVEKTVFVIKTLKENGKGLAGVEASYVIDSAWYEIPYPTSGQGTVAWMHEGLASLAHVRVTAEDGGNYTQVNSVNLATNSTVTFTAHRVKIVLQDSTGQPLPGGNAYVRSLNNYLGVTNGRGEIYADLFGESDQFRMEYEGTWKTMTASTTAPVVFKTTNFTMRLIDHNGDPIEGGVITHNGYFFGTTGADGWAQNELFPATVTVTAKYKRSSQAVKNYPLGTPIVFQTGLLHSAGTASLIRPQGASGYTPFVGTDMELLPGVHSVKFAAPTLPVVQTSTVSAAMVTNIP